MNTTAGLATALEGAQRCHSYRSVGPWMNWWISANLIPKPGMLTFGFGVKGLESRAFWDVNQGFTKFLARRGELDTLGGHHEGHSAPTTETSRESLIPEENGRPPARRSRKDVLGEVMRAISEGVGGPTRLMYKANLSWTSLLEFLEVLLLNGLITGEVHGSRMSYTLTDKGISLLDLYTRLDLELAPLGLEKLPMSHDPIRRHAAQRGARETSLIADLTMRLNSAGARIVDRPQAIGRSGQTYHFDLLVEDSRRSKHAYLLQPAVSHARVISLHIIQFDIGFKLHVISMTQIPEAARGLARKYSLDLVGPDERDSNPVLGGA